MGDLKDGQHVYHTEYGPGEIQLNKGTTAIVRFERGLEECRVEDLEFRWSVADAIDSLHWDPTLETITKILADAILSVNQSWGVFSRSKIQLLPHQLWVCHKVLSKWPIHYLVGDDVGLGKTIEAGLILWPLLSRGTVRRLLIVCPSSLVEQWQYRLKEMFDIRMTRYLPEADTKKADFWNTQNQVVASLQTLRLDHKERHTRILEAEPWDLLIVDESHHLNAHEDTGATLGYRTIDKMIRAKLIKSSIFFTGTPHRGKDYGFLALLSLLREDLFDPSKPTHGQLSNLREVFIRNNKQNVVDMQGNKIFKPVKVSSETYTYTPEESRFYELLTEFIVTGKAYASSLSAREGKAVMLVLIAMQKLASSSIAAISKAIDGRLARIGTHREALNNSERRLSEIKSLLALSDDDYDKSLTDELQVQEERIADLSTNLQLMENEVPQLQILAQTAKAIHKETKIEKVIEVVEEKYAGRQVLFFTEYKATQALLMSALIKRFGDGCVTFINGDNKIEGVRRQDGGILNIAEDRYNAADRFNQAQVRFLVSTEAAGEGIDLQENCWSLIHVDLPWNPMRLHQRVGRLNRYGQKQAVEVVTLRNPDTVEARIWDKLNEKIESIMKAIGSAMDEPEDLMQLVLGMTSPSFFNELFSGSAGLSAESLANWFDTKSKTFGGKGVIETVKELVGHSEQFDYQDLKEIPKKDLEDLQPFFETMLLLNKRRVVKQDDGITFKTPDEWLQDSGVRKRYENLVFNRTIKGKDASVRVLGVGHRAFDQALNQARNNGTCLAMVKGINQYNVFFSVRDRVTTKNSTVRQIIFAVQVRTGNDEQIKFLKDWEAIDYLNKLLQEKKPEMDGVKAGKDDLKKVLGIAQIALEKKLVGLDLPFDLPEITPIAMLVPSDE
ncbi:MAG TPA: SNF2-related protein [Syntrophorhabdus sp.]|nr:SNF2-related protein [Syntrophorhabdus sp.]